MAGKSGRLNFLERLFFPPRCSACNVLLEWRAPHDAVRFNAPGSTLCPSCVVSWEEAEREECGICASSVRECLCMPQRLRAARVHALFKLIYYVPRARERAENRVIYHIKEQCDRRTLRFLAYRLSTGIAEGLRSAGISLEDCVITYLPRSARAVRRFGFDQSERLAHEISLALDIPAKRLIRRRLGANCRQKSLDVSEREANARKSFIPAHRTLCDGKTVLLVDDIVTTGAGLSVCSRLLYGIGARRVLAISVAVDDVNRDLSVMGRIRRDSWDEKHFFDDFEKINCTND